MGLFLYDSSQYKEVLPELLQVRRNCRDLVSMGIRADNFRIIVKTLMRHGVMVVPTDLEKLTPLVQRIQQIAHITGIRVMPLASYIMQHGRYQTRSKPQEQATAPVAASAVPPTQHPAAAGQPTLR